MTHLSLRQEAAFSPIPILQKRYSSRVWLAWLFLTITLLPGCGDDLRLHTASDAELQRSHEHILARLPEGEAQAFDAALRDIVVERMGLSRSPEWAALRAEYEALDSASATPRRDYAHSMAQEIAEDWENQRIPAIRDNASALLDRRSVPEIIELARKERERARERAEADADALLAEAEAGLADLQRRLAAIRPATADDATLGRISVTGPALMMRPVAGREEAILTFTLRNDSEMAPGRVHFLATVVRGGLAPVERRAVIAHDIPGGLPRGATQRHVMSMTRILEETLGNTRDLFAIEVTLSPIHMEDARAREAGDPSVKNLVNARLVTLRNLVGRMRAQREADSAGRDAIATAAGG